MHGDRKLKIPCKNTVNAETVVPNDKFNQNPAFLSIFSTQLYCYPIIFLPSCQSILSFIILLFMNNIYISTFYFSFSRQIFYIYFLIFSDVWCIFLPYFLRSEERRV